MGQSAKTKTNPAVVIVLCGCIAAIFAYIGGWAAGHSQGVEDGRTDATLKPATQTAPMPESGQKIADLAPAAAAEDPAVKTARESGTITPEQEKTLNAAPPVGEDGVVNNENACFSPSEQGYNEFMKTILAKDKIGYGQAFMSGQAVTLPKGTKIHMLEACGFLGCIRKVRIMSGDHFGEVLFTAVENLSREGGK